MLLLLVRSLHVLAAIWFTCGVAGYIVARLAALHSDDLGGVDALVKMMSRFRNQMIRPGGMLLVIFGLWTAYDESWPRFSLYAIILLVIFVPFMVLTAKGSHKLEALRDEAKQSGAVTPALRAGMRAQALMVGDYGVVAITVLFLLLMLLKPA